MPMKLLSAVVAVGLLLAYVLPVVVKMREPSLAVVIIAGIVAMAVDLWQTLRGD